MEDIKIERYKIPKLDVYKSDGTFYGTFNNSHECDKFRIKMLENNMTDEYFFMWGNIQLTVNKLGEMSQWPPYLYDETQRDFHKLFQMRKELLKKPEN